MSNIDNTVKWGIIGCGDVCEVKSGPAFNKVANSELVAVMRRNEALAADYAKRHKVPKYYTDAEALINDPEVNAVYIATPPSTHEEYAIRAMAAGKPVYIEKPLSISSASTKRILDYSEQCNVKAVGAYYRRGLPLFKKVKELVLNGEIGNVSLINVRLLLPNAHNGIAQTADNWRINPDISGGGLFYDLAPHMLDIIYWIFGEPVSCTGQSWNQENANAVPDFTLLNARFKNGAALNGTWSFHVPKEAREDTCQIIGEKGYLQFSFFPNEPLKLVTPDGEQFMSFENPENIQLNLIQEVVGYFRGKNTNPCAIKETLVSMEMMDAAS